MGIDAKPFNHVSWIEREVDILSILGRCKGILRRTSVVRSRFKSLPTYLSGFIRSDVIGISLDEDDEALKAEKGYYLTPGSGLFCSYIASQALIDAKIQKKSEPHASVRIQSQHLAVLEAKHNTIPPEEWQKIYKLVAQIKIRDNPAPVFKISTRDPDNPFGHSFIVYNDTVYALDRKQSLGRGAFGRVRLAYNENNETLAIKIMLDSENNKHYCFQRYAGVDFKKALYFINFSQTEKINIALNLAKEIETFHSLNIIHGDICPRNIVMDSTGTVRLIDLGQARKLPEGNAYVEAMLAKKNGTVIHVFNQSIAAPETVKHYQLSKQSDIFAFALFLQKDLSLNNADELINKMLDKDAAKRPSIAEAIDWLKKLQLDYDLQRLTLGTDKTFLQTYAPQPHNTPSIINVVNPNCKAASKAMRSSCCLL